MEVNMDYVKNKAAKQWKNRKTKTMSKRNKNKDKGVMKAKEDIKDYFCDYCCLLYTSPSPRDS